MVEDARAKRVELDSLVHYANAIGSLSIALGRDASNEGRTLRENLELPRPRNRFLA